MRRRHPRGVVTLPADLHLHSHHSDGDLPVDELLARAREAGLSAVAVTDHDSFLGARAAAELAPRYGLRAVFGVEISATDPERGNNVHLLAYCPRDTAPLEALIDQTISRRREAGVLMRDLLAEHFPISREELSGYSRHSPCIYRQQMLQALTDKGIADGIYGAFQKSYLNQKGGLFYRGFQYPTYREAIAAARESGAAVIMAHPSVYRGMPLLHELVEQGLIDGAEAYHPRICPAHREEIAALCQRHGLIATGGSDYHGRFGKEPNAVGSFWTDDEALRRIAGDR